MAGKSDKFEYDLLKLVFNGTAITNVGATAGTTAWWIGLLASDPTDAGSTASEATYTNYVRYQTDRSTQATTPYGWNVSSGTGATNASASPVGNCDFAQCTTASAVVLAYFGIFPTSAATASSAIYWGTISPTIALGANVTPRLTTASSVTED